MGNTYKKAIVLGAGGFIGIHLVNELSLRGYEVVCFDKITSARWPVSAIKIQGDIGAPPNELLNHMEHALVFHLISISRPSLDTKHIQNTIELDLLATIRCLEATAGQSIRWVFISSGGTVYGDKGYMPIREDASADPICSYGLVKLMIERYFSLYKRLHHVDYVIVRPSNPYGPGQDPLRGQGLIPYLIYKALKKEPIEIWGDGSAIRDYIYISDAVQGIISLAVKGRSGEVYNVGTGIGHSVNSLVELIAQELGTPLKPWHLKSRPVDVQCNILSTNKIFKQCQWEPKITLGAGVMKTALYIKNRINHG